MARMVPSRMTGNLLAGRRELLGALGRFRGGGSGTTTPASAAETAIAGVAVYSSNQVASAATTLGAVQVGAEDDRQMGDSYIDDVVIKAGTTTPPRRSSAQRQFVHAQRRGRRGGRCWRRAVGLPGHRQRKVPAPAKDRHRLVRSD